MITLDRSISGEQSLISPYNATRAESPLAQWLLLLGCAGIVVAITSIAIWSLNRGYDFTDEGYSLLLYAKPSEYASFSSCQQILAHLPKLCSNEIVNFRLLWLLTRLSSAVVLAAGVCAWARQRITPFTRPTVLTIFLVTAIANYVAYSLLPPTLSYNGVTSFLILVASGLFLIANATPPDRRNVLWSATLFIAGSFTGFCLFVKVTSAAALAICLIVFFPKDVRATILYFVAGIAAGVALYFMLFDTPTLWLHRLQFISSSEWRDGTHVPGAILRGYLIDVGKNICRGAVVFGPIAVAAAILYFRRNYLTALIGLACGAASTFYAVHSGYLIKTNLFYVLAVGSLCMLFAYTRRYRVPLCWQKAGDDATARATVSSATRNNEIHSPPKFDLSGLFFLGILPLVPSFGTDAELLRHAAISITPLLLMCCLCALMCSRWRTIAFPVTATISACFAAWLFTWGFVLHPFRLSAPLIQQSVPAPADTKLQGLFIDSHTAWLVDRLNSTLRRGGLQDGDPILAFYELPGIVYATGGRSAGYPWFRAIMQNVCANSVHSLQSEKYDRLFILLAGDVAPRLSPKLTATFREEGIPFPNSFELLDVVQYRNLGWWDLSRIYVYALKKPTNSQTATSSAPR